MEAKLLQRLEAVVGRLESWEAGVTTKPAGVAPPAPATAAKPALSQCPPMPAPAAPAPVASAPRAPGTSDLSEFDELIATKVAILPQLSVSLAPEIQTAVSHYVKGMQETRSLLDTAARSPAPDMAGLQALLAPVGQQMMSAGKLVEGRRTAAFNHLKVVSEAMQALSWLAYTGPTCGMSLPGQHVSDSWQSADFYASKLLMESRGAAAAPGAADAAVAWVKAIKEISSSLEAFVRNHHPQGLKWNTKPGAAPTPAPMPTAAPAPPAAPARAAAPPPPPPPAPGGRPGPPPPPPPGPPPKPLSVAALAQSGGAGAGAGAGGEAGMSALFKELQQGEDITKSLKKVTDDMKAKNRTDRTGLVSIAAKTTAGPAAGGGGAGGNKPAGPARMEYDSDRKKWVVENQVGRRDLVLEGVQPQQGIYIFGCKDCVITVKSKANAISIDSCVKTGVVFGDLICACEVINSRSLQLQCTGYVPTVSIEKTDGVQLYVSKEVALKEDFQVVTAKCSEINVHVLPTDAADQDEPVEHPVPEQFISSFDKAGHLITRAAAHSGA